MLYDLQINTLRSRPLSGHELPDTTGVIAERAPASDIDTYDSPEYYSCSLMLRRLPALDAFREISSTFGVTLSTKTSRLEYSEMFRRMSHRTHDLSLQHAWTTWYVCESPQAIESSIQDLSISAGLRKEGYFSGIDLFRPSPGMEDTACRRRLFDQAIRAMAIPDKVVTQIGDDVLYMRSELPWKLVFPSHQIPGGGNPLGFYACGFSGTEEALAAGQRLIERFAKKVLGVSFVCVLTGEGYNTVFRELSAEWPPWDITVMGTLGAEAISILKGGEISERSPGRIPAFTWYSDQDVTVYGSVVIEEGQRYLEIATDDGTLEQLQERVAFLNDIYFTPVPPPA